MKVWSKDHHDYGSTHFQMLKMSWMLKKIHHVSKGLRLGGANSIKLILDVLSGSLTLTLSLKTKNCTPFKSSQRCKNIWLCIIVSMHNLPTVICTRNFSSVWATLSDNCYLFSSQSIFETLRRLIVKISLPIHILWWQKTHFFGCSLPL